MNEIRASFDVNTVEGKMRVFNAQNGASISMKNLDEAEVIDVVGVLQYTDVVNSFGKPQEATITVLFTKDGKSYAGVSETVAQAGEKLITLIQEVGLDSIPVRVVKAISGTGKEFLNLQIVA